MSRSVNSTTLPSKSPFCPYLVTKFSLSTTPKPFTAKPMSSLRNFTTVLVKAQPLDFFNAGFGSDRDPISPNGSGVASVVEEKEPECPEGLRKYETMMILRPDMTEDQRLALTQKYEGLLAAGGGMYVEVFNSGIIPLAYAIKKKNKAGECNTYLDGIQLRFTYYTKPESIARLEETMKTDDDVVRSMSFKIRKRKH